ncbi:MAG: vanadium-dependent haloperoxidase [Xenococcaceae cyanobacterium MO_188.B29]|nr:vanadium-dependent haloperoxidase [Xenococcaceae cyanobacterium MO_188.B29]
MDTKLNQAYAIRVKAASTQLLESSADPLDSNGDEALYSSYEGSFTKLLSHDSNGVLTDEGVTQYEKLVQALETDNLEGIGRVRLQIPPGTLRRVFINPQSAFSFEESGADVGQVGMPPAPSLSSRQAACEMLEVYGASLLRDVRFAEYGGTTPNTTAAMIARVMESFGDDYAGPKQADGSVSPGQLYRGITEGDTKGGLISQFLLLPLFPLFPSGCAPFVGNLIGVGNLDLDAMGREQKYFVPSTREFLTTEETFVAVQNGELPEQYMVDDYKQSNGGYLESFLDTGRHLGGLVHVDSPYEAYYNALYILIFRGAKTSPAFPYSSEFSGPRILNQGDGHTMGPPDAFTLVARACIAGFKAAWAQKWRAYRRLRPEVMGARVHFTFKEIADLTDLTVRAEWDSNSPTDNPYSLHPDLLNLGWEILNAVRHRTQNNGNLLLTQMYPEGSPAHPAYPSGHATVAGACTTILKAMFDDTALLPPLPSGNKPRGYVQVNPKTNELIDYQGSTPLTIGGELDKLGSNIAHGRDFGGVHYRSDGDEGLLLGERVAIRLLMDHARTYPEAGFRGFEFSRRDGVRIRVTKDDVIEI